MARIIAARWARRLEAQAAAEAESAAASEVAAAATAARLQAAIDVLSEQVSLAARTLALHLAAPHGGGAIPSTAAEMVPPSPRR